MTKTEGKKTILLVDDVPVNLRVAHEILKPYYKTRIATSGAAALKVVKSHAAPELILLDVTMPEMDGFEVCTRLKADPVTRDIPVIFVTAMTEVVDETRGFAVGAVDYIRKPFSPHVLLARVRTHLKLREEYEQLVETVFQALPTSGASQTPPKPETATPVIGRLRSLLEARDSDAADATRELADALAGKVDAQLLAALRSCVDDFDFERALVRLNEIASKM